MWQPRIGGGQSRCGSSWTSRVYLPSLCRGPLVRSTPPASRAILCPLDERNEEDAKTEIQLVTEAEREISGCITLLHQVDPGHARPYTGAWKTLHNNNADRARHILSSLRELWRHLLRRLVPDDLVFAWIPGMLNHKGLLHDDKPTRRARVLYVCRDLNNSPLTDLLICDTVSLVKLIELFNRVHELDDR